MNDATRRPRLRSNQHDDSSEYDLGYDDGFADGCNDGAPGLLEAAKALLAALDAPGEIPSSMKTLKANLQEAINAAEGLS